MILSPSILGLMFWGMSVGLSVCKSSIFLKFCIKLQIHKFRRKLFEKVLFLHQGSQRGLKCPKMEASVSFLTHNFFSSHSSFLKRGQKMQSVFINIKKYYWSWEKSNSLSSFRAKKDVGRKLWFVVLQEKEFVNMCS